MEVSWWVALCLSTLCLISTKADTTCKSSCKGDGGPFLQGNVYKYELEGSTVSQLPGSSNEVTSLAITAIAEVSAETKCQHVLKLSNVAVKGPDGQLFNGLNADCTKPVKFSYNDGKLGEICGESDDRGVGLNIKRAIISLLSSVKKKDSGSETGYENDIFGICPTDFTFTTEGSKLTIQKTRNLNRCALREQFDFPFPTTAYQAIESSFGSFETSPVFGAQLTVQQEIDNGILKKATGKEHYTYTPLLNNEVGASVTVSYTLTLRGSSPGSIQANVISPKSVYYEPAHDADGAQNHESINAALQRATSALDPVATPEAAKEFADLISVIEQGSKEDILLAYRAARGNTAKNLFLDGLLMAGSADSVEAAAELLSSNQIPEEMTLRWYLDLNLVKHASRGSLSALLPLLSKDKVPHQAYLGIGAVAGKFCIEHQQLCETCSEFKELISKLSAPLASGCRSDSHDKENTMIASLKGLRNSRHFTDDVAQLVSRCASDKTAKTRVRVAAIEAFSADAGKRLLKDTATSILKDVEEDSELRIKAYLALVESPCPHVADTVKDLIDNEPINQVGSFIVSHLRNLRATVSPDKEGARQFLGNIIPKKKYPIDQRKFSRNYEVSYGLDALNFGAVGEINRIFSQKSFIPRSVSLNLTTQIFGHSVNLAEIGLRAENFERLVEKYFGPMGIFKTKGAKIVDEAIKEAEETVKKAKERVESSRTRRSVTKQQTEDAANKILLGPDYDDLHADFDLSLKLFGSDIAWMNYHHDHFDYEDMKKKLNGKLDETLDQTKTIDIDFKKARRFLDVGLSYPTGLGFSLKVKVGGYAAVNVKVKGNADLKSIMNNPQNAHVAFQVVPSGSVELKSLIVIDADVIETGVKVSANLHSSTGTDFTVKVLDGYGIDVKLGLPVKKQEILNFQSDIVSVVKEKKGVEKESPIKFNVKRQDHGGCFDQLSTLTGLIFCGEISLPMDGLKLFSAAYGPSKASIRLEKEDESLTAYHFKAFYNNKVPDHVSLEVLLDTPNSRTNRKFSLDVQGSLKPQKQLLVTVATPLKQAMFEGLVVDTETEQALSAKLTSDGDEYFFKVGAHVSADGSRKKFEPILEYKYPESSKPSEKAWISRKQPKAKTPQSTYGVTGAVIVDKNPGSSYRQYELKSVTLTTPKLKLTVDGFITIDDNLLATDLTATYDNNTFTLNSKIQKKDEQKYTAKIDFLPSQYPDLGGSVKWEYEKTPQKIENKLVVVHGPDLKSEVSRLSVAQLLKYKYESVKVFDFYTENTVTYPVLAISAAVKGGAKPTSLEYDVDITYDKNQVQSKLDAKTGGKNPTDYSIDFEAKALGNSVDLSTKHERISSTKSKFTNSLEVKPGGKYQLNALHEFSSKPGDIYQSLSAEVKLPKDPKNLKLKTEFKHNSRENELEFELIVGNKPVVDIEFELEKKTEPSGKFKLSLPKYIESQGTFETVGGKGTASFQAEILKTGRKIEGHGEFTKTESHLKGSGEILWDATKDPNNKIHFETDTEIVGKSIDSKNSFAVLEYKTDVNVKASLEGSYTDGTLKSDAQIVLPSGRVFESKIDRVFHFGSDDNKVEGTWEILDYASKAAQPCKVILKVAGKNINLAKVQFDGQTDFTYVSSNGEDIVLHVVGKKIPQGDKWSISGQTSVTGSLVKYPLKSKLNAEVSDQLLKGQLNTERKFPPAHYDFELQGGNDIAVASNGKINQDQLINEFELKLPADLPITSVKWQTSNTLSLFLSEGTGVKVVTNNAVYWNVNNFVKLNVDTMTGKDEVNGKITLETHSISARTLKFKAHGNEKEEKGEIDLSLQYEGKSADINIKVLSINPPHVAIASNLPSYGRYELDAYHKETDGGESGETLINAAANNDKYTLLSRYSKSKTTPFVDVDIDSPKGKSRFYVKLDKKEEKHMLVESKLNWISGGGGSLELSGELNVKSLDDLYVKMSINSPKLNINKLEFEASKKQTKSAAKTIAFHGKSAENEFSGSLTLQSKGVSPNLHYEGNGVLRVGEKSYPLQTTIKYDLADKDKPAAHLEIKAGQYSYSAHVEVEHSEVGNKAYIHSWEKYCNEDKCKEDALTLKSDRQGKDYEVSAEIKLELSLSPFIDLQENPLIFKSDYSVKDWRSSLNTEISHGSKKIQYREYLDDEHAGFELTLPKRVIASEVAYAVKVKNPMSVRIEGNFWLDKKNAEAEKTSLLLSTETTEVPDGISSSSVARFNTPGLKELLLKSEWSINKKDHLINGKLEADVFAKKNQKLVAEYKAVGKNEGETYTGTDNLHIHSKGLNIEGKIERKIVVTKPSSFSYTLTGFYIDSKSAKREAVAKFSVNPNSLVSLVKLPEGVLYSADITYEKGDNHFHGKGKYEIGGVILEEDVEVTGTQVKVSVIQKNANSAQLDINGHFALGQVAEINGKFNNKPIGSLEVALDENNFLKSKYNYNIDVAKELLKQYKDTAVIVVKEYSRVFKESGSKIAQEVTDKTDEYRKSLPNFKPAIQHYQKKLQQMKEELLSNTSVKDAVDLFYKSFGTIIKVLGEVLEEISNSTDHIYNLFVETLGKTLSSIKDTIPKLKKMYEDASDVIIVRLEKILGHITNIINDILDKIKEHEKDIQEITGVLTDFLHEMGQLSAKTVGEVQNQVKDFVTELCNQIQALPAYSMLKEKLQEVKDYKIPEQYWQSYHEIITSIQQVLPTPELQHLLVSFSELLEKVIRQQPFDKADALQQLKSEVIAAVRSVIAMIEAPDTSGKSIIPPSLYLPLPSVSWFVAPPGSVRFSLLHWIRASDLPSASEIFHTYRPRHSLLDLVPPFTATALLIDGTEFLTFDKKQFSFKGTCSYILTTDIIDGNFTLVANIEAGKLKSIAAFDRTNSVELLHDDNVLVNGKPSDLPVYLGDLNMWRKYQDGTGFATYSGITFFCTPHLKACAFSVNGFYFGKTRGLLGTYNNEPYDDNTMPEGKVAKSTTEFTNSWKVNPQCPADTVNEQPAPQAEQCTKLFSGDSNLRSCFAFENPDSFREACNRLVAGASGDEKQEKACNIAQSYVGYCYYVHFIRINLPDYCGKCQVGSHSLMIGESAQIKVPQNQADVVFVIEQLEENEEVFQNLVTPLIPMLKKDFKDHGITDVKFTLVGYGSKIHNYPSLYTFNGKYNEFTGTAKDIHFEKQPEVTEPKMSDKLEELKEKLNIELGLSKVALAFKEAFNYPFRPEALKIIVGIVASGCDEAVLPLQPLRLLTHRLNLLNSGIVVNVVTPLKDLKIEGKDEKAAANIVGFDSYSVYTQSEARKKVLKGDEDAYRNLKYTSDICTDLALGTNGAVFSSMNFLKGKPTPRKNFLQVLSIKITESPVTEEFQEECKCILERGMSVKTKCKIISRKEKEALVKGGGVKGGVKG